MNRRGFLLGVLAAPVIVKAAWIMPVKKVLLPEPVWGKMILNGFDEGGRPVVVVHEILQKDVTISENGFYRLPLTAEAMAKFGPESFVTVQHHLHVPGHLPSVTGELGLKSYPDWEAIGPLIKDDH